MPVQEHIQTDGVHIKVYTAQLEDEARNQLIRTANMPFMHHHVSAMPDVHAGLGATIGSVIATKGAVIPAAVGVDIGCGMRAVRLGITKDEMPKDLADIREAIENAVPHGRTDNGGAKDTGGWRGNPPEHIQHWWTTNSWHTKHPDILMRHKGLVKGSVNTVNHMGTLGTGNHFIEVCLDESDHVWVVIHSGSRGVGNRIGSYFIQQAKQEMKNYFIRLPDPNLAYLVEGTQLFNDYMNMVQWAQDYAYHNRAFMMSTVLNVLRKKIMHPVAVKESIDCHHNYVDRENHYNANVLVTRKGAIRARAGDKGIIPGSMGARSYIVCGLGNQKSFCSASHGAGRTMSRKEAKRKYSEKDLIEATIGIECRKDANVIDEIPYAYKDIDVVMENQHDLVTPVHTLRQIINIKG